MSSDNSATHGDIESMKPGTSGSSFSSSKRNKGKVPKRIHKSEREKLKREHLNDLFLNLANALESCQQNSGKASVLSEAARVLKDLLDQTQVLQRENKALLSESRYVLEENDELREEASALGCEIRGLENEIQARKAKPELNVSKPHARYPTPADSWPSRLLGL